MAQLTIRIEFENGLALGPGKVRLLEHVVQQGSIRGAAVAMGMSYRRAWLLIHEVEAMMGASVITAETGGTRGGGTTLTDVGRTVVEKYRSLEAHAAQSLRSELRALARMTRPAGRPARSRRKTKRAKTRGRKKRL
jgi:molybdate transport system regulatory protein